MNVLVLNCGSSTVKFQLIATDLDGITKNEERRLARGGIERVGGEAIITLKTEGREQQRLTESLRDMRAEGASPIESTHRRQIPRRRPSGAAAGRLRDSVRPRFEGRHACGGNQVEQR